MGATLGGWIKLGACVEDQLLEVEVVGLAMSYGQFQVLKLQQLLLEDPETPLSYHYKFEAWLWWCFETETIIRRLG